LLHILRQDKIKELINTESNNIFFKLICDMVFHGVRNSSYRLRAEILMKIFPDNISPNNCILIDCQVTASFLCKKLFVEYPTFRETSKCSNSCAERLKVLPLVNINALISKDVAQIEKDVIIQPTSTLLSKKLRWSRNYINFA